jgi:stage II sporulation protein D
MKRVIMVLEKKHILFGFVLILLLLLSIPVLLASLSNNHSKTNENINNNSQYVLNGDSIISKTKREIPNIKVFITEENKVEEMNLEDYVRGVLSGEMPVSFEMEALKAQAVAARTYAVSKMSMLKGKPCELHASHGADICDTVHCQVYKSKEVRFKNWDSKLAEANWNKLTQAVMETGGQVLSFNGELASQALYFSSSSGRTEDALPVFASEVPYLKSVESSGEENDPKFSSKVTVSLKELTTKINKAYPKAQITEKKAKSQIEIKNRNPGNTVNDLKIGNETIKGRKFRELFNLNSANFKLNFLSSNVEITCYGYGHGVGMSQGGANVMAKDGKGYKDILTHYYTGISIKQLDEIKIGDL